MHVCRESTTAALSLLECLLKKKKSLLEWRVGTRPQHQKSNWPTQDRGRNKDLVLVLAYVKLLHVLMLPCCKSLILCIWVVATGLFFWQLSIVFWQDNSFPVFCMLTTLKHVLVACQERMDYLLKYCQVLQKHF